MVFTVFLWLFAGTSAWALEIVDFRWGFDGKVVRHRFNVLSVQVDNPRPEAFEGQLVLQKSANVGSPVDAPMTEPVYVGPFARRWVQFFPYVGSDWETYAIQPRPGKGPPLKEVSLDSPKIEWPARVILNSSDRETARRAAVRGFAEELFPPFVTATDGLQAVLIDHVPSWDELRRKAFLNWVYLGGYVFILNESNGSPPEFPASFGPLLSPLDEFAYGSGRIIRVAQTREELSREEAAVLFAQLPPRMQTKPDGSLEEVTVVDDSLEGASDLDSKSNYSDGNDPFSGMSFLNQLKKMTRPEHNWVLLHGMFWVYIVLIFPGCWLIGRRWSDYRLVYLTLLGAVAVFSVLFGFIGQRGYGESTAVNSVAIIRPLPDGTADVSAWANAFVTSGGDYEIRHEGTGLLYSTCNIQEGVAGVIQTGTDGRFVVDIPPFSSRELALRGQMPLETVRFSVKSVARADQGLELLTITPDKPLPIEAEQLVVLYGKDFFGLNRDGNDLKMGSRLGELSDYLRVGQFSSWEYRYGSWNRDQRPLNDQYRDLFAPLLSRSLNISHQGDVVAHRLPSDTARVFYFAPLPKLLEVQNRSLGKQGGWALYVTDVRLNAGS